MGLVVVPLGGAVEPAQQAAAEQRLRIEAGLGGVVLIDGDRPSAVVVHELLAARTPRSTGEDPGAWVRRLRGDLLARGYLLEHLDGTPVPGPVSRSRARAVARRGRSAVTTAPRLRLLRTQQRWSRRRFLLRLRWAAWLSGTDLELDVAPDLVVGRTVRLQLRPGRVRLQVGPRCTIADGVLLRLGGELVLGRSVQLRHDVGLNVKGRLELAGRNVLGRGTMVHADGAMLWEWGACSSERVSVLDSNHDYDGSLVHVHDQGVVVADVVVGAGTLLGAGTTVLPGVRVGRTCLVGSGSVVTRDVPDGWIAVGAPATPLRRVDGAP